MRQPISVNVFLYRKHRHQREYLLLHRVPRPDLDLPAFWQGVTGAMESGETLLQTAVREVWEETGLNLAQPVQTDFQFRFLIQESWRKSYGTEPTYVVETCFYGEVDREPTLSEEHSEYRWLTFELALPLLSFGDKGSALRFVEHCLNTDFEHAPERFIEF